MVSDIKKTVVFDAPIEKVWEAVSTSEGIAAWFMPNDFQPVKGHEFHLESPYESSPCRVVELDPPNRLSFTWSDFGWLVTFELKEREGKTEFTLTHAGWGEPDEAVPRSAKKHSEIRERMNKGWDSLVDESLRKVVEN